MKTTEMRFGLDSCNKFTSIMDARCPLVFTVSKEKNKIIFIYKKKNRRFPDFNWTKEFIWRRMEKNGHLAELLWRPPVT
jgi:hypothetical protein